MAHERTQFPIAYKLNRVKMKSFVTVARFALLAVAAFASYNATAIMGEGGGSSGCQNIWNEDGTMTTVCTTVGSATFGSGFDSAAGGLGSPVAGGGNVPNVSYYILLDGSIYEADSLTAGYAAVYYNVPVGANFGLCLTGKPTTYWTYRGLAYATPFPG